MEQNKVINVKYEMSTMLKRRIEFVIKHYRLIQLLYKRIVSFCFRVIGIFVNVDDKLILFSSFGGKKYNDSPRVLFERLKDDVRYSDYRFVWAFQKPNLFDVPGAEKVKIDTIRYFLTALKAKVWITSVNIERGLHFKKKDTIYINTWHGAGTKLIGNACAGRKDYDFSNVDILLVQSDFEREIFIRDFCCRQEAIRMIGFPRNDELFSYSEKKRMSVKEDLHIPKDKKVILYAPTWRDSKDGGASYEFSPPFCLQKWEEAFSEEYVMLFRMHAFTTAFEFAYDDFARNVSDYENLNDLLEISDVVITDYSTIVYDCAVAQVPFICFGFDYEAYKKERGFYYDLDQVYPGGICKTEDDVIERIPLVIGGCNAKLYDEFRMRFIEAGGSSATNTIQELSHLLGMKDAATACE